YTVSSPSQSGTTTACGISSVPHGFVISGVVSGASNNGYKGGLKIVIKLQSASSATSVCSLSPIPPGSVITNISSAGGACTSSYQNYVISIPDAVNETQVCGVIIPPDYVVTAIYTLPSNNPCGNGAYIKKIKKPNPVGTTVCSFSNIPEGFIVTSINSSGGTECPSYQRYSVLAAMPGAVMCKTIDSYVPKDYVVISEAGPVPGGSCPNL